ncbi:hypothetical protein PoB_001363000 [Plakobranchus ocellatus]|uniref:Uncharacterized protein n=1 Tax=Plakobranchus ocellatus TaxID=259542 RepID=A0AAV3YV97_9GAST|nr:hypothetical protein PoB_001363000 [Plakobranchus ocellatus]
MDGAADQPSETSLSDETQHGDSAWKFNFLSLLKLDLQDPFYDALKSNFFMTGKGRRPKLPDVKLTNKLLLQLFGLKVEKGATWAEMMEWFQRLLPAQPLTKGKFEHRVEKVLIAAHGLRHKGRDVELLHFLETPLDLNELPQPLSCLGLNRTVLLGDPLNFTPPLDCVITNRIVSELDNFRSREGFPHTFLYAWVKQLGNVTLTFSQLRYKLSFTLKKIKEMKKNKINLDEFLDMSIFKKESSLSSGSNTQVKLDQGCTCASDLKLLKENLTKSKDKIKKLEEVIQNQSVKLHVLDEEQKKMKSLKDLSNVEKDLVKQIKELKRENNQLSSDLSNIQATKLYKNNSYLKKQNKIMHVKNSDLKKNNSYLQQEMHNLKEEINLLKSKIKIEQTSKLRYLNELKTEKSTTATLMDAIKADEGDRQIKVREEKYNQFSDNIRLTYMALQGEANVAASNCTKVVQIVSQHMFNTNLASSDLPSCSAALNFADEAHHVSKYQIVDYIRKSNHFTLATDGTSRQKKHFIERHIILDDGTAMSVGFTEVASDDAQTLLEKTIDMFNDLCEVYTTSNKITDSDQLLKEIVVKMKSLMSDRASVMKLFDKRIAEFKNDLLGEETSTHFLFCNAHFLLGLSKATEDALKIIETDIIEADNKPLGRDTDSTFSNFVNSVESAACRLIRLSAEVLGPRGDEKNGCREEWLAYCSSQGIKSIFTSFRSNRFNNLFENASAVIYHHSSVLSFLSDYCSHCNLKLKSIIADFEDVRLVHIIAAMSLFHVLFSAPYWSLMNSSVSYGQFPAYVQKMEKTLEIWSNSLVHIEDAKSVFEDFKFISSNNKTLEFINSLPSADKSSVLCSFKIISQHCFKVLKRQLADFLDGGPFAGVIKDDIQTVLNTCPLTNLIGERMFGDLDFDMTKRRHASTHLRSTINMWKHNRTSQWMGKLNWLKARKLLSAARKHRADWKRKSKLSEKSVKDIIKQRIMENNRKKKEKETEVAEKRLELFNTIISHGGFCTTKSDVDKLYRGPNAVENLKAQLRYRKFVLNEKNVKLSGNKKELYSRLLELLGLKNSS